MIVRYAVFVTILSGVVFLTHAYIYRRLVRDAWLDEATRRRCRWLMVLLGLGMVSGIGMARLLPRDIGVVAGFLAYGWMGMVVLLVTWLLALEWVRFAWLLRSRGEQVDPERRLALARGAAALTVLGSGGAGAVGVHGALRLPEVTRVDVPIDGLPPALDGLKVAQISDIHIGPTIGRDFLKGVVERVNGEAPDLVAITGDLVDGTVSRLTDHTSPLADLKSRHGSFFVTGNHEYYSGADTWIAELERLGVRVLRNERVELEHDGTPLDVLGVDDWRAARMFEGHGHDLEKACAGRDPKRTGILLAHQPRAVPDAEGRGIDLVLCGHTHGGQIWPWGYFVALVQPYVEGLHRHDQRTWVYVNRGTGYWGPPMRVLVPPEITLLTLRPGVGPRA